MIFRNLLLASLLVFCGCRGGAELGTGQGEGSAGEPPTFKVEPVPRVTDPDSLQLVVVARNLDEEVGPWNSETWVIPVKSMREGERLSGEWVISAGGFPGALKGEGNKAPQGSDNSMDWNCFFYLERKRDELSYDISIRSRRGLAGKHAEWRKAGPMGLYSGSNVILVGDKEPRILIMAVLIPVAPDAVKSGR